MSVLSGDADSSPPEVLGQSESFLEFQERISRVAPVERPVLILGERGTGKELAAARIHYLSQRWSMPLVTLNCAALTSTLIGAELFGYEKGAFTGAQVRQKGRFELAGGGTLFLDEIGSIPMEVQEKILRVVEYGSFERVGSSLPVQVDVRIVAAANVNLAALAQSGEFKQDLLDRLSFEVIHVPPLRFRYGDIKLLANHFAHHMAFELGRDDVPVFSARAMRQLESHTWPGNVRELKNVVERAVYQAETAKIDTIVFDPFLSVYADKLQTQKRAVPQTKEKRSVPSPEGAQDLSDMSFKEMVAEFECRLIRSAQKTCRYHQKKTAQYLGLSYDQFRGLLKKHQDRL